MGTINPETIATAVAVARAALALGTELAAQLERYTKQGGDVPGLAELIAKRDALRALEPLGTGREA